MKTYRIVQVRGHGEEWKDGFYVEKRFLIFWVSVAHFTGKSAAESYVNDHTRKKRRSRKERSVIGYY